MHRLNKRQTQALKELAAGPLISAIKHPRLDKRTLNNQRGPILLDSSRYKTQVHADPVPFNDDIPF